MHLFFLWRVSGRVQKADPDFTVYYTAAKILREGRGASLYAATTQDAVQREFARNSDIRRGPLPYIHPPFEALLFLPFTLIPYFQAFLIWNLVNLGILASCAIALRRALPALHMVPLWEWMVAMLAFFPVFSNFLQGQDAILLLFLFVLAFCAFDRGALFLAGCWLGLGVFKYHFALPLVLLLVIWKGRRLAKGFLSTASIAVLLSVMIVGWHGILAYPAYAWRIVSVPGHGQTPLGLMPNLIGLLAGWPGLQDMKWPVRFAGLGLSLVLLIVLARMRNLLHDRSSFRLAFACAVIAAVLVGYNTNAHDLSLLVLPLALFASDLIERQPALKSNHRQTWIAILPILPLLISPLWMFLWLRWNKLNLMVIPLLWWMYAMAQQLRRPASAE
jgi:hypothetical protein